MCAADLSPLVEHGHVERVAHVVKRLLSRNRSGRRQGHRVCSWTTRPPAWALTARHVLPRHQVPPRPAGRVMVSVYSSGAIGRLVPSDVAGMIGYLRSGASHLSVRAAWAHTKRISGDPTLAGEFRALLNPSPAGQPAQPEPSRLTTSGTPSGATPPPLRRRRRARRFGCCKDRERQGCPWPVWLAGQGQLAGWSFLDVDNPGR